MNPLSVHADGLQALVNEMGDDCPVLTWNGKDRAILPGSAMLNKDLTVGGFSIDADFRCHALISEFLDSDTDTPQSVKESMPETPFEYLGEKFKIKSVSTLPGNLAFLITANSENQGA